MLKPPTMQDIAAAAGVSVTTVSHALSGRKPVRDETAARIRRVIAELGYVPDAAGQRLRLGRSRILGLALPDISNWFFARIAQGVEQTANRLDYGVIICSTASSDPRRESRYFNMLRTRLIDGLVYAAGREPLDNGELVQLAGSYPIVLADEAVSSLPIPTVSSDNLAGGRLAARGLADLGHTRVVMLAGVAGLASTRDRVAGAREFFPHLLVLHGDFEEASGYQLMNDVLASEMPFTAVLCGNDRMALGAIRSLREAGRLVPSDVSVVGFDDVELAALVQPPLTTVRQHPEHMGARAAELLIANIEGDRSADDSIEVLPVEFVERGTTARRGHAQPFASAASSQRTMRSNRVP